MFYKKVKIKIKNNKNKRCLIFGDGFSGDEVGCSGDSSKRSV